ncbi:hypothetical protein U9M48_018423 [Paspalum notatum var. saurae]|uniref:Uncharacterized protein n=1 Tax=Paspalum notatum var. saurae TaxID=547442 RepID=A0AAQ3WQA5_PASNO
MMASPAATGGSEHRIEMPLAAADSAGGELQTRGSASAKPEKSLNIFVRFLATGELVGNAVGALASLWASVILLAGYRSSLDPVDFWIATVMIFVEGFRVFVRNFKFDNQSLFGSTKAFGRISSSFARILCKPCEGNQVVLIIGWVLGILEPIMQLGILGLHSSPCTTMLDTQVVRGDAIWEDCWVSTNGPIERSLENSTKVVVLTLMSRMQLTEAPRLMRQLRRRRPLLLWVVLVVPSLLSQVALYATLAVVYSSAEIVGIAFFFSCHSRGRIASRGNGAPQLQASKNYCPNKWSLGPKDTISV